MKKQLDSLHGSYIPDRALPHQAVGHAYDDVNTVRVQFNTWHRGRQLIDFVILVQRLGANGWEDVERFDCCHGCCHLHRDGRDGNDPLWQLDDEKGRPEAFVRACDQAENTCAYHPEQREGCGRNEYPRSTSDQLRHEVNLNSIRRGR